MASDCKETLDLGVFGDFGVLGVPDFGDFGVLDFGVFVFGVFVFGVLDFGVLDFGVLVFGDFVLGVFADFGLPDPLAEPLDFERGRRSRAGERIFSAEIPPLSSAT